MNGPEPAEGYTQERVLLPERSVFAETGDRPVNSDARAATLTTDGDVVRLSFEISARDYSALPLGSTYTVPLTHDEAAALERMP